MQSSRLQLNAIKTEFMWCVPSRRRHSLPAEQPSINQITLLTVGKARNLRVYLNSELSTRAHIIQLVRSCFGTLRQLRSIRRSLPKSSLATLTTSFIMTKVDYCNVALAGLPQCDLDRLQTTVNAAARLTADARKFDHITPLMIHWHWLRVPERILYQVVCADTSLSVWLRTEVTDRFDSTRRHD